MSFDNFKVAWLSHDESDNDPARFLTQPEGYVRSFVDEGEPMVELLTRVKGEGRPSSLILHPLVEPLTIRELEILRWLKTELSSPEVARELMVSVDTVRFHTKNIYSKLAVTNRRAAVRRADELGL